MYRLGKSGGVRSRFGSFRRGSELEQRRLPSPVAPGALRYRLR